MTYTVEISKQADLDLRGIFEYIAFTLHSACIVSIIRVMFTGRDVDRQLAEYTEQSNLIDRL
jgi:hypothetical protein